MLVIKQYSVEELRNLKKYKRKIVDSCATCNGSGYVIDKETGFDELCDCMMVFCYVKALVYARIPVAYWQLHLSELTDVKKSYRAFIKLYLHHFENAIDQALGIFFLGTNGIGKTALMCEVGKSAIIRGFDVRYFTAQQYISSYHKNDTESYAFPQVLLLDELDKAYMKEASNFVPKVIEDFLRRVISKGKIVIAASNEDLEELTNVFGASTISMIQRHLKIIKMSGEDRSDGMQRHWMDLLHTNYDFMHPNIVRMAKLKMANLKKDYNESK